MSGIEENDLSENLDKMDYVIVTKGSDVIKTVIVDVLSQNNCNQLHIILSDKATEEYKELIMWNVTRAVSAGYRVSLTIENQGLAKAREIGIANVVTPWFVFVDDDCYLPRCFSEVMTSYLKSIIDNNILIGGLVAVGYRNLIHRKYYRCKFLEDLESAENGVFNCIELKQRMFTYATMMRKSIVRNWSPPENTHAYEDYLLTQHILSNGYRCFQAPVLFHHNHSGSDFKAGCWNGAGGRQTGRFKRHRDVLKYVIQLVGGGIKQTFKMNNDWFAIYSLKVGLGVLWGYLRWKKYLVKKI